jgi:hypothetical protein
MKSCFLDYFSSFLWSSCCCSGCAGLVVDDVTTFLSSGFFVGCMVQLCSSCCVERNSCLSVHSSKSFRASCLINFKNKFTKLARMIRYPHIRRLGPGQKAFNQLRPGGQSPPVSYPVHVVFCLFLCVCLCCAFCGLVMCLSLCFLFAGFYHPLFSFSMAL